jgi:phosphoenolpyruvate carboxykinase (ATP)
MIHARDLGLKSVGKIFHNLGYDELFAHESKNAEGRVAANGTMMVDTGKFTGRSPKDKYFVHQLLLQEHRLGQAQSTGMPEVFDELHAEVITSRATFTLPTASAALTRRPASRCVSSLNSPGSRTSSRTCSSAQWATGGFCPQLHCLQRQQPAEPELGTPRPQLRGLHRLQHREERRHIGGTWYGGEMKKGIFTMMNPLPPGYFHALQR